VSRIPAHAHFVWLGERFPDLAWLAVRAAAEHGAFAALTLWTDSQRLGDDGKVRDLVRRRGVALRQLGGLGPGPLDASDARRVASLAATLASPAARSDLWRLMAIAVEGGVYLDADAITLRPFTALLEGPAFVGAEHVCLPAAVVGARRPWPWLRAGALLALRHALTLRPGAARRFKGVASWYDLACNNAVFGAHPAAGVIVALIARALALPPERARRLYELGPRLWEAETGNRSSPRCAVVDPAAFYPLAPEICADYVANDPSGLLGSVPDPACYAAHLYDSVLRRRVGGAIDRGWLARHRRDTLLGRMAAPFVDELCTLPP